MEGNPENKALDMGPHYPFVKVKLSTLIKLQQYYERAREKKEAEQRAEEALLQTQNALAAYVPPPANFRGIAMYPDIMENICQFLDPNSLDNLKKCCKEMEDLVAEACGPLMEQKYYRSLCLTIVPESNVFPKILKSFNACIGKRSERNPEMPDRYEWKMAYFFYHSYKRILRNLELMIDILQTPIVQIKTELFDTFFNDGTPTWPFKYVTAYGSNLLHVQDPPSIGNGGTHIRIYENNERVGLAKKAHKGSSKILSVTIWELSNYYDLKDIHVNDTPSLQSIIVVLTQWNLQLHPSHGGEMAKIKLDPVLHESHVDQFADCPPYAFNDKGYLGFWFEPSHLRIYMVKLAPVTRNVILTPLINIVHHPLVRTFWRQALTHPKEFLPILINGHTQINCDDGLFHTLPEFGLVSPTFQNIIFGYGNPMYGAIEGTVRLSSPSNVAGRGRLSYLNRKAPIEGHASGHKRLLFWSAHAAHFLIRPSDLWISRLWPRTLEHTRTERGPERNITAIEFTDISHLLICGNGYINWVKLEFRYPVEREDEVEESDDEADVFRTYGYKTPPCEKEEPDGTHKEGNVFMTILRKIDITSYLPKSPYHIRMDFCGGLPYIFMILDHTDPEQRSALSWDAVQISFDYGDGVRMPTSAQLEKKFLDLIPKEKSSKRRANDGREHNRYLHGLYMFL